MVEQGWRKPKDGYLNVWAAAYGASYVDLCKCIGKIPLDLVGTFKGETEVPDPFISVTELEKFELLPFLEYVRWVLREQTIGAGSQLENEPKQTP